MRPDLEEFPLDRHRLWQGGQELDRGERQEPERPGLKLCRSRQGWADHTTSQGLWFLFLKKKNGLLSVDTPGMGVYVLSEKIDGSNGDRGVEEKNRQPLMVSRAPG